MTPANNYIIMFYSASPKEPAQSMPTSRDLIQQQLQKMEDRSDDLNEQLAEVGHFLLLWFYMYIFLYKCYLFFMPCSTKFGARGYAIRPPVCTIVHLSALLFPEQRWICFILHTLIPQEV